MRDVDKVIAAIKGVVPNVRVRAADGVLPRNR
jgi:hypothetical protein